MTVAGEHEQAINELQRMKMRDVTPEESQSINDYLERTSKPTGLTVDDIIENRPTDKVVKLAKEIFNIGYEAGVQATNVDCGVVWEERIDDIKADIYGIKTQKLYEYVSKDNIIDTVIEIINKHIKAVSE